MKDGKTPNPNVIHPIKGYDNEIHIKPTILTLLSVTFPISLIRILKATLLTFMIGMAIS